jgi:hypothetical protein
MNDERNEGGYKKVDSCNTRLALFGVVVATLVRIYRKRNQ